MFIILGLVATSAVPALVSILERDRAYYIDFGETSAH